MSELTLVLIRFAYLAILWIFVLSAISVIRSDMFGARVPEAALPRRALGAGPATPRAASGTRAPNMSERITEMAERTKIHRIAR